MPPNDPKKKQLDADAGKRHVMPAMSYDADRMLSDARLGKASLFEMEDYDLADYIVKRWERMTKSEQERLAEIKVNFLNYQGQSFVQVDPTNRGRVYVPPEAPSAAAPTINKIRRTVQRYVAQITADEPVMEGEPASHSDEDRDSAEAATEVIRGEWHRMKLKLKLQKVMEYAGILRTGYWLFQWDEHAGGKVPAKMFFDDKRGEPQLLPVDEQGNQVPDTESAAKVRQGDMTVSCMTPVNVRYTGSDYAHNAKEVIVSEVMTLRELYEMYPPAREARVSELMPSDALRPSRGLDWLRNTRTGESFRTRYGIEYGESSNYTGSGDKLGETDGILDDLVQVTQYFRPASRTYEQGFHGMVCGKFVIHRGPLRYGIIPIAQFKCLDDPADTLGYSLVDLIRDPQALLDFVNTQVLRYLQMLRRRWFVPLQSGINKRDLQSPTTSVIPYNANAGNPIPEEAGNIPNSVTDWVTRFDQQFDDQSGIHDTLQGKHVAGVSSGRHAEALRSGDETLLGLTRAQMVEGLETAAKIMLKIAQTEWSEERRVAYLGENRMYVEKAFSAADFSTVENVRLKNSTLLMLTPAQRLETILTYAQVAQMPPEEVRELAPLGDVAGISVSEDVHYQRARRQNARFLNGPPPELVQAREKYEAAAQELQQQKNVLPGMVQSVANMPDPNAQAGVRDAMLRTTQAIEKTEMEWNAMMAQYTWSHRAWEDAMHISRIHAKVHAEALASEKARRLPPWWYDMFDQHCAMEMYMGYPEMMQMAQGQVSGPSPGAGVAGPSQQMQNPTDHQMYALTGGQSNREVTDTGSAVPPVVHGDAP